VSVPEQIGPYAIVEKLGEGGMGEVYLARDTRLGREVAIKMLPAAMARDPEGLARFRREALTLAALNHPNIATIHGFELTPSGDMALVLERVHGETLGQRIRRQPLRVEEALEICTQIAEALEVAHEQGVIHRDLKPGNVMLGPRGLVKVLDFGLARSVNADMIPGEPDRGGEAAGAAPDPASATNVSAPPVAGAPAPVAPQDPSTADSSRSMTPSLAGDDTRTQVGAVVGTPGYMSPEQAMGVAHDARADIFSFGCVLYEALAARRAFPAQNDFEAMAAVMYAPHDLSALPERTPARVRDLLDRCLQKDPEQRLASIASARHEIEEVLGVRRASALRTGEAQVVPSNLPKQLAALVGRENELAACLEQLARVPLLTLTGVGGCGKTRMALAVGESMREACPDGVWFADLAPLSSGDRVVEAVAVPMGLREEQGRSLLETLVEHLAHRRVLLVLDNCEHLIAACVDLAMTLVQRCPELKIVATSREALNVPGESVYAVPSLGLPASGETRRDRIAGAEAVRLFVARAAAVRPGFDIDDSNAPAVAEICLRLDGIPLAIELAAARVRMLEVTQIREKLDDRFRLLTGGSRTALPRQQTLRATIQWSYDQLVDEERAMLRALAVFAGGWTLGSATAIAMESGDEFEVLDLLTRLVDKSLVVVDRSGGSAARYRFLETVRQYALEQLKESGEEPSLRERHLEYFLVLAETSEKQLTGPRQAEWFRTLETEHENLRGALAWCGQVENGDEAALRLAGSISRFWSARGHYEIGRASLLLALALGNQDAVSEPRALALVRAASLALYQGDYASSQPLLERAAAIYRELGDKRGVARALSGLAAAAIYQMDYDSAERVNQESYELYSALGQKRGMAVSLHNLAFAARCRGELETAQERYEAALGLLREVGDQEHIALTLGDLATTIIRRGEPGEARTRLTEALAIARQLEATRVAVDLLDACAELALAEGQPGRALRFRATGGQLRAGVGLAMSPIEEQEHARLDSAIRERLGPGDAESAGAGGDSVELDSAAAAAIEWLEDTPGSDL